MTTAGPSTTRPGDSFQDADVVEAYLHRPEYAPGIYGKLVEISPEHRSLLDLGCGTGKIARRLSGRFESVTAIDPSSHMLRIAREQPAADPSRIRWVHGPAEHAPLDGAPYDLVVAAASIHWMDHAVVFPRLLRSVSNDHVFAAVDGDGPAGPPWQSEWDGFLAFWIHDLTGEAYRPEEPDSAFLKRMNRYRRWLDVAGEISAVSEPVSQRVEDFIACQHSRATFAPARLGARLTRFDQELRAILAPYADRGVLSYSVRSNVVWGTIRSDPAG